MSTYLGKQSYSANSFDVNIWRAVHGDGHRPLTGIQNIIITVDSGTQFTIKQGTAFSIYTTDSFTSPATPDTQNNSYPNSTSITYFNPFVIAQPSDFQVTIGVTSGFSSTNATYYLYASSSDDSGDSTRGEGEYAATTNAPTWSDEKQGWYHATDGKALAKYVVSGGNITNYEVFKTAELIIGNVAPTITPGYIGQRYINKTTIKTYTATGTATSSDWLADPRYAYGSFTLTGGGGDHTETLPFDWTNGTLHIYTSETSSEYFDSGDANTNIFITTHASLTSGTYSTHQVDRLINRTGAGNERNIIPIDKTVGVVAGVPKSATSTSFTVNDDGATTVYCKYTVIA
jgi:hypothetical protein